MTTQKCEYPQLSDWATPVSKIHPSQHEHQLEGNEEDNIHVVKHLSVDKDEHQSKNYRKRR